jgi:hypothetical protein
VQRHNAVLFGAVVRLERDVDHGRAWGAEAVGR